MCVRVRVFNIEVVYSAAGELYVKKNVNEKEQCNLSRTLIHVKIATRLSQLREVADNTYRCLFIRVSCTYE